MMPPCQPLALPVSGHAKGRFLSTRDGLIALTPKEYVICHCFLDQKNIALCSTVALPEILVSYLPVAFLQQQAGVANRLLLQRHMSNLNAKLSPFGLHISAFHQTGYIFSWQRPVEKERAVHTKDDDGDVHPSSVH